MPDRQTNQIQVVFNFVRKRNQNLKKQFLILNIFCYTKFRVSWSMIKVYFFSRLMKSKKKPPTVKTQSKKKKKKKTLIKMSCNRNDQVQIRI